MTTNYNLSHLLSRSRISIGSQLVT